MALVLFLWLVLYFCIIEIPRMQCYASLRYCVSLRDSARPVSDLRDDERDGVDGGSSVKVDLFEQSVQVWVRARPSD